MNYEAHDQRTLSAIEPLRAAGFALHWLHPRQKRPIGERWQEAPFHSLSDLISSHRTGNNLGTRLGDASFTAAGYLHVLDMDIRVPDLADECWIALRKLLGDVVDTLPCVQSGSGGESRHLYLVTDKPFFSKRLAVSEGKHRRDTTDAKTGEAKQVWSYDWEIELFGTGKQVAMPPSIHPDTGKPYVWVREFDFKLLDLGMGPEIASSVIESLGAVNTTTYAFETREPLDFKDGQLEAELDLISISDLHYDDWIRFGQALHHQFGGSDAGWKLWLQHTKRSTKYDKDDRTMRKKYRSFGRYRGQPVTMATVRQWAQDARAATWKDAFDDLDDDSADAGESDDPFADILGGAAPSPAPAATEPAAKAKVTDVLDDDYVHEVDWTSLLDLNEDGVIKPTLHNVELIVRHDPRLVGLPQLNEFTQETVQRTPPGQKAKRRSKAPKQTRQLEGRIWDVEDTLNGELWSDDRDFAIRSIVEAPKTQGGYGVKLTDRDLKAAVVMAASSNCFHPVREYLSSVTWDGVPRVDQLWIDYVKAPDDAYHRSVARIMMVAAVTRIFEPGHKFDFATILEGLQGKRKSTLIKVLGRSWFAELDGDFHDAKQMIELMQGSWLMEIPELTGFGRADVRAIKAFISRQKDRARLAYARRAGEFPRQCIFIGSTNDREYLKDDTGGRRFWPVECRLGEHQEIDTDLLEQNVDQLWAEAVAVYRSMREVQARGTLPLYLVDADARVIATRLQESRRQESSDDVLVGQIAEWLDRPVNNGGFDEELGDGRTLRHESCTAQIWVECLGKDLGGFRHTEQGIVNRAMRRVPGWGMSDTISQQRFAVYGKQRVYFRGGEEGRRERAGTGDLY